MQQDKPQDSYIRLRIAADTKQQFQQLCKSKAINSSELLRQLITQWIHEQQDITIIHKRSGDI